MSPVSVKIVQSVLSIEECVGRTRGSRREQIRVFSFITKINARNCNRHGKSKITDACFVYTLLYLLIIRVYNKLQYTRIQPIGMMYWHRLYSHLFFDAQACVYTTSDKSNVSTEIQRLVRGWYRSVYLPKSTKSKVKTPELNTRVDLINIGTHW